MSQHAIEDLIETTIHLVDQRAADDAQATALMHGLLDLQARYDTSLTWFRMHEVLLRRGVLLRTPVDTVDDTTLREEALAATETGWLRYDDDAYYLESENGVRVLYRQAPLVAGMPVAALLLAVLDLAVGSDDATLAPDWYGLLVNGWIDGTLDSADGIASTLDGLLASEPLLAIRTLATGISFRRRRGVSDDLAVPRLADEIRHGEVEREFALRFFLEPKRTPRALLTARDKARARQARIDALIPALIQQHVGTSLRAAGWQPAPAARSGQWCWTRDVDGSRQSIWFTLETELGVLMVQVGLQHAQLLAWQQRAASDALHDLHFQHVAAVFFGAEVLESEDIGDFGGWVLDPKKDDAALAAALDRLAATIPALDAGYFGFIARHFPEPLFAGDIDRLLHLLAEGNEDGTIPEELLFDSPDSLLLAFVFHHLQRGEEAEAQAMIERLRARHVGRTRLNPWLRDQVLPFLQQWDAGRRDQPMPAVLHSLLARHLGSLSNG